MGKAYKPSLKTINTVLASATVRAALEARARRMAPTARATARAAGAPKAAAAITYRTGTRPGTKSPTGLKRSYARIVLTIDKDVSAELKRARLSPTKLLRRAASGT